MGAIQIGPRHRQPVGLDHPLLCGGNCRIGPTIIGIILYRPFEMSNRGERVFFRVEAQAFQTEQQGVVGLRICGFGPTVRRRITRRHVDGRGGERDNEPDERSDKEGRQAQSPQHLSEGDGARAEVFIGIGR